MPPRAPHSLGSQATVVNEPTAFHRAGALPVPSDLPPSRPAWSESGRHGDLARLPPAGIFAIVLEVVWWGRVIWLGFKLRALGGLSGQLVDMRICFLGRHSFRKAFTKELSQPFCRTPANWIRFVIAWTLHTWSQSKGLGLNRQELSISQAKSAVNKKGELSPDPIRMNAPERDRS